MAQEWEQRGIPAVALPQSDSRMIPSSERLYDAAVHKRLVLPDDDELNAHVHAAVAKSWGAAGASTRPTAPQKSTPSSPSRWPSADTPTSPSIELLGWL
jgi:hypothetical protein